MYKYVFIRTLLQISASKLWSNLNSNLQCSNCLPIHLLFGVPQEPFPVDKMNNIIEFKVNAFA